ncbi:MAG: 4Fe-4S binding protein [Muribaculaceae bacterium]|nr:4Fe-4S binding protein [Muribaculaceae bacterium]
MKQKHEKVTAHVIGLLTVFILLASLALVTGGKLMGHKMTSNTEDPAISQLANGSVKVNTTVLGKDIAGYAGTTPLDIYITNGVVDSVTPLPNEETPGFFKRLEKDRLFDNWKGVSAEKAASMEVDAVSGATFSSKAVIANVKAGCNAYVAEYGGTVASGNKEDSLAVKTIVVLLAILSGAILPLFIKNKTYRTIQEVVNVAVLGFWGGTFVDYAMMIGFFVNGYGVAALSTILLLIVALLYPIFGHDNHYCNWMCPYGSLQELCGKVTKKKIHISPKGLKFLDNFRYALWVVLIVFLFAGWGTGWIDYEIFTAFIVKSASAAVIVVAAIFLVLSVFVQRPFCRFVCPTGSLLKILGKN